MNKKTFTFWPGNDRPWAPILEDMEQCSSMSFEVGDSDIMHRIRQTQYEAASKYGPLPLDLIVSLGPLEALQAGYATWAMAQNVDDADPEKRWSGQIPESVFGMKVVVSDRPGISLCVVPGTKALPLFMMAIATKQATVHPAAGE